MSCKSKSSVGANEKAMNTQLNVFENAFMAAISEHRSPGEATVLGSWGGHQETRYPAAAGSANFRFDDCGNEDVQAEEFVAIANEKVRVGIVADSGASDNVIGFDDLPAGIKPAGPPGKPFSNASGGGIQQSC